MITPKGYLFLGRKISLYQQHHLYDKLPFGFKIPLVLELAIVTPGEVILFTKFLRVILILLPEST